MFRILECKPHLPNALAALNSAFTLKTVLIRITQSLKTTLRLIVAMDTPRYAFAAAQIMLSAFYSYELLRNDDGAVYPIRSSQEIGSECHRA